MTKGRDYNDDSSATPDSGLVGSKSLIEGHDNQIAINAIERGEVIRVAAR
jgi:hypothetical protein